MTHDELLAKIEKDSLVMRHELEADEDAVFTRLANISNALRAVVELHKPIAFDGEKGLFCNKCLPDRYRECETIQAIEKELG